VVTASDYATEEAGIPFSIMRAPQLFGQWLPPGGIEAVYRTAEQTPITTLMTTPAITCLENATLDDVVKTLVERKVHHVIVVREGKPIGVIARHDLLRAMLRASASVEYAVH
jgi:CBS domain-containing protein